MKKVIYLLLFIFIYIFSYGIYEKGGVLIPGAKPSALGGAFCALSDESVAIYYNPAGLYQIKNLEITGIYGGIANIKKNILGGIILNNFSSHLTGAFSGISYLNGNDNSREDIYSITLSIPFINDDEKALSCGVNLKYLYAIYESSAATFSVDIGLLYKIKNILSADTINLGLAIFDMQSSIRWKNGIEEKIPLLIKTGIAYHAKDLLNFTMDLDIINDKQYVNNYKALIKFGVEKTIDFVSLRIGYAGFSTVLSSITFGLGIKLENFDINYSFLNHTEELGTTHKIDIKLRIPLMNYGEYFKIKIFKGDKKVYIKWLSEAKKPDLYKIYIESEKGEKIFKEKYSSKEETNFLIENLENGVKYFIEISAIYSGKEKEKTEKIAIIPEKMDEKIKLFYKNAKVLYSNNKYEEALSELKNAEKINDGDADIIMLKEKIEKIVQMEK